LVRALWRYRYVVVAVALVSAVLGYAYESRKPPVYSAASYIELRNPYDRTIFRQEIGVPFTDIPRYLASQADLVRSPEVMARASALLGGELRPTQIRQLISAEPSTAIFEVTVSAKGSNPARVAAVVNAVADAYEDVADAQAQATVKASVAQLQKLQAQAQQRLDSLPRNNSDPVVEGERTALTAEIAGYQSKAGQLRADVAVYGAGIDRIDRARPPELPISDTPRRTAIIFGLLGFIAALIGALWRSERVRVLDSGEVAAGAVGAPLLGVLPRHPTDTAVEAAPVLAAPKSDAAKYYELVSSTLALVTRESETRLLLLTSPDTSRAKSVTALNLALSAAPDQRPVVLLDGDESAVTTRLLGGERYRGVSDLVELSAAAIGFSLGDGSFTPVERLESFRFVPTGTREQDGRSAIESPQMGKILAHLQQEADLVLVDGPSLGDSPGSLKLAALVDGVILVVRRGTPLRRVRQTRDLLATAKTPIVGFVYDPSRPPRRWPPRRAQRARRQQHWPRRRS
jgi:Mrp family chromosome partitioning ATPase/capsular polysaccharide biosynthesis protein